MKTIALFHALAATVFTSIYAVVVWAWVSNGHPLWALAAMSCGLMFMVSAIWAFSVCSEATASERPMLWLKLTGGMFLVCLTAGWLVVVLELIWGDP